MCSDATFNYRPPALALLLGSHYQKERLSRGTELTVVHESLLEEDNAEEGEALLDAADKVTVVGGAM